MKNFFLFMVSALLFTSIEMQAQTYDELCYEDSCCISNNKFYAEILGGVNFLQTQTNGGIRSKYKTGYIVAGSLGYRWCYGLRFEAEYAFRRNSSRNIHFFGRSFSIHGHFQSSSYMANLLWDLPLASWGCEVWNIQPFIGAGIGYDFQQIHSSNSMLTFNERKKDFAWQVMAGLAYPVLCKTNLSLEYKFHKGGFNSIYSHSLGVGLLYTFGL